MFGYPCPFCNQQLLAAPERSGQRTICPKCLKPIVIPSPEREADFQALEEEDSDLSSLTESDEVPISLMPDGRDIEPSVRETKKDHTPLPEQRPAARIGAPARAYEDSIPLQPAAAALFRNPDSDHDLDLQLFPVAEIDKLSEAGPVSAPPKISPTPLPIPMPSFPEPIPSRPAFSPPAMHVPSFPAPQPIQTPTYPALGRIIGDHPATALPYTPAPCQSMNGMVVFNTTDVEAANIAAQLTTVISMTMNPAQEPPSDLRFTTGLWIILTACGVALWLFCMISDVEPLIYVAFIGAIELVFGYLWVAIAWGKRNPTKGLTSLIPLLWIYRAANAPADTGYRPLRYVIAGAILLTLYVIAPTVQPTLFRLFGFSKEVPVFVSDPPETPLLKLQNAEADGDTLSIKRQLMLFAKPESLILIPSAEKPAVIAILRKYVEGKHHELKQYALRALTIWSKDDAKPFVHSSLTGDDDEMREIAYELTSNWNDTETVQLLLSRVGKDSQARLSLEAIGRTEAGRSTLEKELIPLIVANTIEERNMNLALASEFGGEKLLPILKDQLSRLKVSVEQEPLRLCIAKIQARLGK